MNDEELLTTSIAVGVAIFFLVWAILMPKQTKKKKYNIKKKLETYDGCISDIMNRR